MIRRKRSTHSLDFLSLPTQQQLVTSWQHLQEKGGEESTWPPHVMMPTTQNNPLQQVMTFKIVNQLCPESLQNKFIERSALSRYNTRNIKELHVQKLKLEHTKKVFCTLVQKPGIVSRSSSGTPNLLYDSKKI